jgi:hypothetical protein
MIRYHRLATSGPSQIVATMADLAFAAPDPLAQFSGGADPRANPAMPGCIEAHNHAGIVVALANRSLTDS